MTHEPVKFRLDRRVLTSLPLGLLAAFLFVVLIHIHRWEFLMLQHTESVIGIEETEEPPVPYTRFADCPISADLHRFDVQGFDEEEARSQIRFSDRFIFSLVVTVRSHVFSTLFLGLLGTTLIYWLRRVKPSFVSA